MNINTTIFFDNKENKNCFMIVSDPDNSVFSTICCDINDLLRDYWEDCIYVPENNYNVHLMWLNGNPYHYNKTMSFGELMDIITSLFNFEHE